MNSVTFNLTCNGQAVEPRVCLPYDTILEQTLNQSDIKKQQKGELLVLTNPINPVESSLNNSFVDCLYNAYNNHLGVSLRPDDLWLTIILTFSNYVKYNSERLRKFFVTHDGKQEIHVNMSIEQNTLEDWSLIIKEFANKFNNEWIKPNFSTTTSNDILIAQISLLGVMKNYIDFTFNQHCGIPHVTLQGTLEDWERLKDKISFLNKFSDQLLNDWHQMLIPILDNFIDSYQGNVNNNFWQSCANHIGGSSGPTYISGWILAFTPFNKNKWRLDSLNTILKTGKYGQIETTKIKSTSTIEVPMLVNGNHISVYAGGIVNSYDHVSNTISPSFDWAVFKVVSPTISLTTHCHELHFYPYGCLSKCNICDTEKFCGGYKCNESDCNYNYCFICFDKV